MFVERFEKWNYMNTEVLADAKQEVIDDEPRWKFKGSLQTGRETYQGDHPHPREAVPLRGLSGETSQ